MNAVPALPQAPTSPQAPTLPEDRPGRQPSPLLLQRAAVLGAGVMGSRIAAHLANAGLPVLLLDLAARQGPPAALASQAIEQLLRARPPAFYDPASAALIQPGSLEHDLPALAGCDWVIEAVSENLAIKRELLARAAPHLKPGALFTTNTSGLPVAEIGRDLPPEVRRHWFGTHFFNPPRYMRLLEVICTPESEPGAVAALAQFAEARLGKSIVYARDTPNFIANRIGVDTLMHTIALMQRQGLGIEEVDALTGAALGWPRTGTFRLADMVGIDTLAHVVGNLPAAEGNAKPQLPAFLAAMVERGWLGDKAGQGFYHKQKDAAGAETRLALDWRTLEYRVAERPKFPSLEMARNAGSLPERLRAVLAAEPGRDRAAAFYWPLLLHLFRFAAECVPEAAGDPESVDRAMRDGFNWEMGPFEMWDALGVRTVVERMRAGGEEPPWNVQRLLDAGGDAWYLSSRGAEEDAAADAGPSVFDPVAGAYVRRPRAEGMASLAAFRRARGVVRGNAGASLIDLGDGIAALELHSEKNAIGEDITSLVAQTLDPESDAVRNFAGFAICGDGANFSVGANLFQVLLCIYEEEWEELDLAVRAFQRMTAAIRFCPRPVVVAPFGLCLGGGAEMALHAAARQPHAELYMGLVEAGVGLIPAGGGSKEMALRAADAAAGILSPSGREAALRVAGSIEYFDALKRSFEQIALAKVSSSAAEARAFGYLRASDSITVHRERLLLDAKRRAAALAASGYFPPAPRRIPAAGPSVLATLKLGAHLMRQAEYASEHDQKVANHAARVLCGGAAAAGTLLSEQDFLDLEREAFLSLCGERKTQERIAATLKSGKPLRN